jgi:hypothetical protein
MHEKRLVPIIQTSIRGDSEQLSAKQRRALQAEFAGEYDYVADHWPEVRTVIETLGLYQRALPRAVVKTSLKGGAGNTDTTP